MAPAPESKPAEERPSTPPPKPAAEVPSTLSTPAKGTNGHARSATSATGMLTPPMSSAPSTPQKARSIAEREGSAASPPAKGTRQKRLSFFGKIKAKLSPSPNKEKGARRVSGSPSPSPMPSPNPKAQK